MEKEKTTVLNERTMVKIPIALAITICLGLIGFGRVYYEATTTHENVEDLEITVSNNETHNRSKRSDLKKELESDDKEMEARIRAYVEQEVSGLRSDWERDSKEQNRRIEKLEK